MKTVDDYVLEASRQLNDQAAGGTYVRWTFAMGVYYLNLALAKLATDRADAFTVRQNLTLVAGPVQTLPNTVLMLRTLYHNVASGAPIFEMDWELSRAFAKPQRQPYELDCQGAMRYDVEAYAYNPNERGTYVVSPPVPVGMTPSVSAMVTLHPIQYTSGDGALVVPLDERFANPIYFWMLARAWDLDNESAVSADLVKSNEARYYNAINSSLKYEGAAYAGATLGQEAVAHGGGG